MMQNSKKTIISLTILLILSIRAYGQIDESKIYSLDELFILALENNQNIKLSEAEENIAQERIAIAKNQQLPSLSASLSAYYLGDIKIFDNPFSNQQTIDMPRTGNSTILQANQLIYNGNTVNNSIKIASLQQKIASLTLLKKVQDTKLLISGYYLDLYRLMNQHQVYKNNIQLAESRLNNIKRMHEQGLLTQNDILRTKLILSNYKLKLSQLNRSIELINNQLITATGLAENIVIHPDSTILKNKLNLQKLDSYQDKANDNNINILISQKNIRIAEKNVNISKASKLPSIPLFASNSMQRPISSKTPILNKYMNGWKAGLSLNYNISSLYKSKSKIRLSNLQLTKRHQELAKQRQVVKLAVHSAYLNYKDSIKQWETAITNQKLAENNFNSMNRKYMNQLILLTDLNNAVNAKLEAELQFTNAEIYIIYASYQLRYTMGQL